jgi:hypothetical protein
MVSETRHSPQAGGVGPFLLGREEAGTGPVNDQPNGVPADQEA